MLLTQDPPRPRPCHRLALPLAVELTFSSACFSPCLFVIRPEFPGGRLRPEHSHALPSFLRRPSWSPPPARGPAFPCPGHQPDLPPPGSPRRSWAPSSPGLLFAGAGSHFCRDAISSGVPGPGCGENFRRLCVFPTRLGFRSHARGFWVGDWGAEKFSIRNSRASLRCLLTAGVATRKLEAAVAPDLPRSWAPRSRGAPGIAGAAWGSRADGL